MDVRIYDCPFVRTSVYTHVHVFAHPYIRTSVHTDAYIRPPESSRNILETLGSVKFLKGIQTLRENYEFLMKHVGCIHDRLHMATSILFGASSGNPRKPRQTGSQGPRNWLETRSRSYQTRLPTPPAAAAEGRRRWGCRTARLGTFPTAFRATFRVP